MTIHHVTLSETLNAYTPINETERVYLRIVRSFMRWFEREYGIPLTIADINIQIVERYRQWCLARTTRRVVEKRISALRWWGHWLVSQHLVSSNPLEKL